MERRKMGGRVTDTSRARWDAFCTQRGVTLTGLLEALGEHFDAADWVPESVIQRARQIDRERYSRR